MTNRKELQKRYKNGERDFSEVKITNARLTDFNVPRAIFRNSDLSNCTIELSSFDFIDLSGSNLRNTRIDEVSFDAANLSGVNLSGAFFTIPIFRDANLSYVNLSGAFLGEALFKNSDFTHANLTGTTLRDASFKKCNFSYANLSGIRDFRTQRFKGTVFHETIMPDCSIRTDAPSN